MHGQPTAKRARVENGHHARSVERSAFESVVKIFTVSASPNMSMPWQMKRQVPSTSSGFIIEDRRILCNAHGVAHHTSVRVRKHGDATKYTARVLAVGHECDLALLTVDLESDEKAEEFWRNLDSLTFGDVPRLQEEVVCIGYPTGGDNISVTKGVVSRVDVSEYSHAAENLLAIQIDAAINAGNSGGPTLRGGEVVGVAFETLDDAENVGYIIPIPVVMHFLNDIKQHGKYTGFVVTGFHYQPLENTSLRRFLKMNKDQHGIVVSKVLPLSDAFTKVQPMDVLLEFDGVPIADDGTVQYREGERVNFRYLSSQKFYNDRCVLKILRDGKELLVSVTMHHAHRLVPVHLYDRQPTYYVWAGLVFTALSRPFLQSEYGKHWGKKSPIPMCDHAFHGIKKEKDEEVVVLADILVSHVNIGYDDVATSQVTRVNGVQVRNVRHVMELIEGCTTPYVRLQLGRASYETVVLHVKEANAAHAAILKENNIGQCKSSDLRPDEEADSEPKAMLVDGGSIAP